MAITNEVSAEARSQVRYVLTDTGYREKPSWVDDVPEHIKAFEAAGGKVYHCQIGESVYTKKYADKPMPFRISNKQEDEKYV